MTAPNRIKGDWYDGAIPDNVRLEDGTYVETAYSFSQMHSMQSTAIRFARGSSVYSQSLFDLGEQASVRIGEYTMINNATLICDNRIEIGSHTLISWGVIILDNLRYPPGLTARSKMMRCFAGDPSAVHRGDPCLAKPVRIGSNVWIGFDCCIFPGVTIHDGSVIGARSVVTQDVPPYTVAAGNPAKPLRQLTPPDSGEMI
jgi:acetyltransferase-like isoleucine patch superfamily enzyme